MPTEPQEILPIGEDEIRQQLVQILASETFRTRIRPSELLQLLVERALQGETLDGEEIRKALYEGAYAETGENVRVAVLLVRKLLDNYYAEPGAYDAIVISLPKKFSKQSPRKGRLKPYPVVFAYNPLAANMLARLRIAQLSLARFTPASVRKAYELFDSVLSDHPANLEAGIGILSCLCLTALYIPDPRTKADTLQSAASLGFGLVTKNQAHAHTRALAAVAFGLYRQWQLSLDLFLAAIKLDGPGVRESLLFPLMCLLAGHTEQACNISQSIALKRVADGTSWSIHAFCLYFAKEFEQAAATFVLAMNLEVNFWLPHFGLAFVYLAQNKPDEALSCYKRADRMIFETNAFMPICAYLAAQRAGFSEGTINDYYLEQGQSLLTANDSDKDWIQIAIGAMGTSAEAAVKALKLAWDMKHPLSLLVPEWPLFDPLRNHPQFVELVREIANSRPAAWGLDSRQ